MTLPPKREQLARTKRVRHIEFEQNPIPKIEPRQGSCKLVPRQHRFIDVSRRLAGVFSVRAGSFARKILIDRLGKDRLRM
jgi:hypothetical protein